MIFVRSGIRKLPRVQFFFLGSRLHETVVNLHFFGRGYEMKRFNLKRLGQDSALLRSRSLIGEKTGFQQYTYIFKLWSLYLQAR